MISKIIQKEKERQEELVLHCKANSFEKPLVRILEAKMETHKQSLINLKEYLDGVEIQLNILPQTRDSEFNDQLREDIKELNKMIEKYEF